MCDDCTGGVIQNGWQMDAGGADPRDQGCENTPAVIHHPWKLNDFIN